MYDPADMIGLFATCVALASIIYLRQLFAPTGPSVPLKPALDYSIYGDLILPTDFCYWVHVQFTDELVRSPVDSGIRMTYPDAYIDPAAYKHFLSTNILPDGTIAFKRIDGRFPVTSSRVVDRSCRLCTVSVGIEHADVAVKNSLQFGESLGWGFFRFSHPELDDQARKL
jgi:hypothetical protein